MPTVLFLCPDHAIASRLAEALFRADAPRGWGATSAAIGGAAPTDPRGGSALRAMGLTPPGIEPRTWDSALVAFSKVVVVVVEAEELPAPLATAATFRWRQEDPRGLTGRPLLEWIEALRAPVHALSEYCRERTPRMLG